MIIQVNLTEEETRALTTISARTGLSVDEIVHQAIRKAIQERFSDAEGTGEKNDGKSFHVYKEGVDPYAPVFDIIP